MKQEQDILKRLLITQQAPQLTLNDMVELALVLIQKVKAVNQAIEEGKVKGEDGYTPLPDIDYLSTETSKSILDDATQKTQSENVKALNKALKDFDKQIKQKLSEVRNGEDAKITPEIIEEIKNKVFSLVQIPDVDKLLDKKLKELKKEMKFAKVEDVEAQLAQIRQLVQEVRNFKMKGTTGGSIFRISSLLDVNTKDRSATKAYLKWNDLTKQYDHVEVTGGGGGNGGSSFNDQTPNTDASYGTLAGDVDGANTTFTVSEGEYLTGKLKVYLNGQLQEQNSTGDWVETTPASGTFDFLVAPTIGDTVTASYETVASSGGIQSVVAGTNVTVDNTDPLNPIVSATGGVGGSGDVVGPASATDNAIARFDTTTGKLIQNSVVTIADTSGNMAGVGTLNTHTIPGGTGTIALTSDLHSAVTVTDSSEINFTLTGQDITASLIAGSIDETKLDASVNASLDLADSASQPGHTHTLANITDVTASVAEVNVLDGVTSTTAELNILDGVTATASEINVLDGITATVTELNYTDGVTSAIQTQLNGKAVLSQATFGSWNFQGTTANGDYILTLKAGFAMTITETTTKCASGTGTATFKINTTALGGTANSVSSSEQSQSHASANSVSAGDDIIVTISSASALTNMVISILATRTLA